MVKLNPDELVVSTFETAVDPHLDVNVGVATKILCTIDPTSCTYCITCE